MLPQPVYALLRRQLEILLDAERALVLLDVSRNKRGLPLFGDNGVTIARQVPNRAIALAQFHSDLIRTECDRRGGLVKSNPEIRHILLHHREADLLGSAAGGPFDDANGAR